MRTDRNQTTCRRPRPHKILLLKKKNTKTKDMNQRSKCCVKLLLALFLLALPPGVYWLMGQQESPCDVSPEALTRGIGRQIPMTCIDTPGKAARRCYYTYVPHCASSLSSSVPLVLDIHGYGSCPLESAENTGWLELADSECFVLVWHVQTCGC